MCVVAMHSVVPGARLSHVCRQILVPATSDCRCALMHTRRGALVLTAARSKLGQPTFSFNKHFFSVGNKT